MDSFLVTGEDSDKPLIDGYGKGRKPSFSYRYTEAFEENCPIYMMAGMSYEDYWDGDPQMAIYYRKKLEAQRDYDNFLRWIQGMYIYEALLNVSPALKPFVKNPEVKPYRERPIPLTQEAIREEEDREKAKRTQEAREAMERLAISINQKFKRKEETDE